MLEKKTGDHHSDGTNVLWADGHVSHLKTKTEIVDKKLEFTQENLWFQGSKRSKPTT